MARVGVYDLGKWVSMAWESGYDSAVLSRKLNVSQRQLQRYTRKLFGRSPQDWLDEQRLGIAAGLILKRRSVKEVAYQLGYKQPSHFSREFKIYYGLSPAQFLAWADGNSMGGPGRWNAAPKP